MKKRFLIIGALLLFAGSAKADGLFSAGWKPDPNVTMFGQKVTWAIPSLCIGAKAGVLPDAGISPDGLNIKIPYLSVNIPFPSLTVFMGKDKPKVELKLGEVNKSEHKPKGGE
tara:strand:- start:586 stop:924 length:339 start_codon:yes stop_codon:yes gene_type:complete